MFSWITGPRITNVIEDLQAEPAYESTFVDPPETPAHQFAVKAFKHAIFGTPAPEDLNNATRKFETKAKIAAVNAKFTELPAPKDDDLSQSPTKRAGGILMTPGTASKGRKTVSFGSQIEDNEGRRSGINRSGVPNDCPGKFPSPWTPGTELKIDLASDKRPRTKLTEALLDARTTTQPKSGQKLKARDDSDITMDLGAPRSDSGKYWKEQYENYAERSEREMKKVVAKQQLAKKFAMRKDSEVTELATKLEQERKRFRLRERELEQQIKEYQERLRQAMAEKTSINMENAALKSQIATLEKTVATTTNAQPKPDFSIYEDTSKEAIRLRKESEVMAEASFALSVSKASSGKENNSPPKSRRSRRQTLPDTAQSRLYTAEGEVSASLAKSPTIPIESMKPSLEPSQSTQHSRAPLSNRRSSPAKTSVGPLSPVTIVPSSPLPLPSPDLPDPWMNMDESSIPQLDKRAMPTAGSPYTNPAWNPPPKKQRVLNATSQTAKAKPQSVRRQMEKVDAKVGMTKISSHTTEKSALELEARLAALSSRPSKKHDTNAKAEPSIPSPTDPKFDLSKITSHHAEGSAKVKHDRAEIMPVDRKAEARRRLEERKKLKKAAPV